MNRQFQRKNPNTKEFWEGVYTKHIDRQKIRSDGDKLLKFLPFFEKAGRVLDFGGGLGGNLKYLSEKISSTSFVLVDQSEVSLEFAKDELLGENDERGNSFEYYTDLTEIPEKSVNIVMSIQVLEHLSDYKNYLDQLWARVAPGGILLISVPVKGIRDRSRQHVNKFTLKGMFRVLTAYAEIVHIAPRSYTRRTGLPGTAYFYVEKPGSD